MLSSYRQVRLLALPIKCQLTIDHNVTKKEYTQTKPLKECEGKPQKPYNPSYMAVKRYYA